MHLRPLTPVWLGTEYAEKDNEPTTGSILTAICQLAENCVKIRLFKKVVSIKTIDQVCFMNHPVFALPLSINIS